MGAFRRQQRWLLVLVCVSFAACTEQGFAPRSPEDTPAGAVSLLDDFANAEVETYGNPKNVYETEIPVKGEKRRVLLMVPRSRVSFPMRRIPPGGVLRFGIGVTEQVWLQPGDGMEFIVEIVVGGDAAPERVYAKYIDPKRRREDQRWFDESISLGYFAGVDARIILCTSAGDGEDRRYDWGGWSGLEIVPGEAPGASFTWAGILPALLACGWMLYAVAHGGHRLKDLLRTPRAYRVAFSIAMASIPLFYGAYPYRALLSERPALRVIESAIVVACCALAWLFFLLWICGPHRGVFHRKAALYLDIALINAAILAVLLEVGLRVLAAASSNPLLSAVFASDADAAENLACFLDERKGRCYSHGLKFNSWGFPDIEFDVPKPDGTFRLVALGDSFCEIPKMPYAYNHLTLIESELTGFAGSRRIDVCNLGVDGKNPREYLALLERFGPILEPDLVVVYFFLGNDFEYHGTESHFQSSWDCFETWRIASRLWRVLRVDYEKEAVVRSDNTTEVSVPAYVADWRKEEPFMPREQFLKLEAARAAVFRPDLHEIHYQAAVQYMETIARLARELSGRPLVMVLVPDEVQVNQELRAEVEQRLGATLDLEKPARYLRQHLSALESENLVIIDLLPRLTRAQAELERVYFLQETHWNVNGNRVAAQEVAADLASLRETLHIDNVAPPYSVLRPQR